MNNINSTPFSDKQLYDMSADNVYHIKGKLQGTTILDRNNNHYKILSIQHDTQTGFDAMAVKDKSGNVMIVYGGTDMNNGNQYVVTSQTFEKV